MHAMISSVSFGSVAFAPKTLAKVQFGNQTDAPTWNTLWGNYSKAVQANYGEEGISAKYGNHDTYQITLKPNFIEVQKNTQGDTYTLTEKTIYSEYNKRQGNSTFDVDTQTFGYFTKINDMFKVLFESWKEPTLFFTEGKTLTTGDLTQKTGQSFFHPDVYAALTAIKNSSSRLAT